jgi:hypothetical protein
VSGFFKRYRKLKCEVEPITLQIVGKVLVRVINCGTVCKVMGLDSMDIWKWTRRRSKTEVKGFPVVMDLVKLQN